MLVRDCSILLSEKVFKDLECCGIYAIYCDANDKYYIGSSKNIPQRILKHRCFLRNGKHQNPHLQNAYNKYGESRFLVRCLEIIGGEGLLLAEKRWMDALDCINNGFNIRTEPSSNAGLETSPATKTKLSLAIRQHYIDHPEARDRASKQGLSRSKEHSELMKQWHINNRHPRLGKKEKLESTLLRAAKLRGRPSSTVISYSFVSPKSEVFSGKNINKFCREHGLSNILMGKINSGMVKQHKGWTKCHTQLTEELKCL